MIWICLDFLYEEEVTFMEAISKCAARGQGFEKFFELIIYIILKITKLALLQEKSGSFDQPIKTTVSLCRQILKGSPPSKL